MLGNREITFQTRFVLCYSQCNNCWASSFTTLELATSVDAGDGGGGLLALDESQSVAQLIFEFTVRYGYPSTVHSLSYSLSYSFLVQLPSCIFWIPSRFFCCEQSLLSVLCGARSLAFNIFLTLQAFSSFPLVFPTSRNKKYYVAAFLKPLPDILDGRCCGGGIIDCNGQTSRGRFDLDQCKLCQSH